MLTLRSVRQIVIERNSSKIVMTYGLVEVLMKSRILKTVWTACASIVHRAWNSKHFSFTFE
jgi:hypothetical protein